MIDHSPDQHPDARRVLAALIDLDGIDCGGVHTFEPGGELAPQVPIGLPDWFVSGASRDAADSPHRGTTASVLLPVAR